jgi:hypothetical protein
MLLLLLLLLLKLLLHHLLYLLLLLQRCVNGAQMRHASFIDGQLFNAVRLEGRLTGGTATVVRHEQTDAVRAEDMLATRQTARTVVAQTQQCRHRRQVGHERHHACGAAPPFGHLLQQQRRISGRSGDSGGRHRGREGVQAKGWTGAEQINTSQSFNV